MIDNLTLEEIQHSAMDMVDDSRCIFEPNPEIFHSLKGDQEIIQQIVQVLEKIKERKGFSGITLYGESKTKALLAESMAIYLGCTYYDLITDDEMEEEEELDIETSQAFSRAFAKSLANDMDQYERVVVCWEDRDEDFYKPMNLWEKQIEDEFRREVLYKDHVIAIHMIDHPDLIHTNVYTPPDFEFKLKIDAEFEIDMDVE